MLAFVISSLPYQRVSKSKLALRLTPLFKRVYYFQRDVLASLLHSVSFLHSYYLVNERVWLEGLLIDFLQKSVFDKWVRRFLVHSAYLFNERVLFDYVIKMYSDNVIWSSHNVGFFDFKSLSNVLLLIVTCVVALLVAFNLAYLYSSLLM